MRMPGFAAQASLYKSIGCYHRVSAFTLKLPGTIRPAQVDIPLICDWLADGSYVCGPDLFGAGGWGGNYGGGYKPNTHCARCLYTNLYKTKHGSTYGCCNAANATDYKDCIKKHCPECGKRFEDC